MASWRPFVSGLIMTSPGRARAIVGDESERHFQGRVRRLAMLLGWELQYHTLDSQGSAPGFPDLVLLHPRQGRALVAELKSEHGRLTAAQRRWLAGFQVCGIPAYCWRPSDGPEIKRVLGAVG